MTAAEFSRVVRVEPLPHDGLDQEIEANPQERAALARLNNLADVGELKARVSIVKWRRGVRVEGELHARVTQTCVVTLEPFEAEIDEPIDVKFLPPDDGPRPAPDEDAPDPLIDGRIDLGALASEFLTLALDPYPRKPGVAFESPEAEEARGTAFAALRGLAKDEEPD